MYASGNTLSSQLEETDRDLDELVKEMCEKLLANTVIEDYRYEVEEVVAQ